MTDTELTDERLTMLERGATMGATRPAHYKPNVREQLTLIALARKGRHADALAEALKTLRVYAVHQVNEGTDHHPTLPSAISKAEAVLSAYRKGEGK